MRFVMYRSSKRRFQHSIKAEFGRARTAYRGQWLARRGGRPKRLWRLKRRGRALYDRAVAEAGERNCTEDRERQLAGAIMGPIRLIAAPIRGIARSRLFQLVAVLAIVLLLDHYSFDYALLRQISAGLKALVDATVQFCAKLFRVGNLRPIRCCEVGLIIAYVYLICLLIVLVSARRDARLRRLGRAAVIFCGCATRLRANAASPLIARGCRLRASGRRIFRRRNGRRPSPGRPITSRPIRRWPMQMLYGLMAYLIVAARRGRSAANLHAVSGADLAWQAGKLAATRRFHATQKDPGICAGAQFAPVRRKTLANDEAR